MKHCCEKFEQYATRLRPLVGGGDLYPPQWRPVAQIEYVADAGDFSGWHVNGCCGGGCFVLVDLKFCPFCGAELRAPG